MTKKLLFVGLVLLAAVAVVYAADAITGKWTYEMTMGRGGPGGGGPGAGGPGGGGAPGGGAPGGGAPGGGAPRVVTLNLKAAGAALTGTIVQPGRGGAEPTPSDITNGKVDGSKVTFDVVREGPNGSTTSKYEGTVSGDSMELNITTDRGNGPQTQKVTAKKG